MSKRESINTTGIPMPSEKNVHDIGDGQSIDPGFNLLTVLWKFGWLLTVILVGITVILRAFFPDLVERHSNLFSQLTATYWVDQAIKISNRGVIKKFKLVGTGLHPYFAEHPDEKARYFFDGQILVMKNYFTNQDLLKLAGNSVEQLGITDVPLTDIDLDEAMETCQAIGARLPFYDELRMAELVCQRHQKNLIKPNLRGCEFNSDKRMWTASAEPGWFFGDSDNFRIYQPEAEGVKDELTSESRTPEYQDNGFESGDIGFRCVKDIKEVANASNQ